VSPASHAYTVERWALAQKCGPRKHAHKLLLLALAITADANGYCWPSQRLLAEQCELTRQTVNEHVAWLVENGYVAKRKRQTDTGRETSCEYIVLFRDDLTWPEGTPVGASRAALPDDGARHALSQAHDGVRRAAPAGAVITSGHPEETREGPREETTERAEAPESVIEPEAGLYGLRDYITGLGERRVLKPEWAGQDYAKPDWQAAWGGYVRANGTEQVADDLRLLFDVLDDEDRPQLVRIYRKGDMDWAILLRGRNSVPVFVANVETLRTTARRFPVAAQGPVLA
jgi:hypothetical protein